MIDTDASICPLPWTQVQQNLDRAVMIIKELDIPDEKKEALYEILTVEDIMGYPAPKIKYWGDSAEYAHLLVPDTASVPEADFFMDAIEKLRKGAI